MVNQNSAGSCYTYSQCTKSWQGNACNCRRCRSRYDSVTEGRHAPWRERKLLRKQHNLGCSGHFYNVPCSCGCSGHYGSTAGQQEYPHWRVRRSVRLLTDSEVNEILHEIPVVHLVSLTPQPVSAIPGLQREFEFESGPVRPAKSTVKIVYVYQPNHLERCVRPRKWQTSEKDVLDMYNNKFRNQDVSGKDVFYRNRLVTGKKVKSGSTIPDVRLPSHAATMQGMKLPLQSLALRAELELVEVKRYQTNNIPSLFSKLIAQVKKRSAVNIPGVANGKYQTIILDFRGQEGDCEKIKLAAQKVKQRMEQHITGATILIQVLLWKGKHCKNCP
jgi:hypothetical protein